MQEPEIFAFGLIEQIEFLVALLDLLAGGTRYCLADGLPLPAFSL